MSSIYYCCVKLSSSDRQTDNSFNSVVEFDSFIQCACAPKQPNVTTAGGAVNLVTRRVTTEAWGGSALNSRSLQ